MDNYIKKDYLLKPIPLSSLFENFLYLVYCLIEPDDYADSFMAVAAQVNPGNHLLSGMAGAANSSATITAPGYASAQLPPYVFPSASQGTPAMPHISQVTMASGVTGGMATYATLNTVTQPMQQQGQMLYQQPIKTEQPADELLNDFPESGSACNSFNLDSGLLQYITDEQADSLTKFLDPTAMVEPNSNPPNAANSQQDAVMMNLDMDNLQDIHNQLSDLN